MTYLVRVMTSSPVCLPFSVMLSSLFRSCMFCEMLAMSDWILEPSTWSFSISVSSLRRASLVSSRTWRVVKRVVSTRSPSAPSE